MKIWIGLLGILLAAGACSGGGDNPVVVDAPDGLDGAIDAPGIVDAAIDAPGPIDGGTGITLTVVRTGMGTVVSAPGGISCGTTCSMTTPAGAAVTLTATPANGETFLGWSGPCTGTASTCTVVVNADTSVGAAFTGGGGVGNLTVIRGGMGTGTVTSSPAGINFGIDCTESYTLGTTVTLTAAAAAGSTFAGWMTTAPGANCSNAGPCVVQVGQATTVRAIFAPTTDMCVLGVEIQGGGMGQVFSSPAGIACAPDCRETYACGTVVTLNATTTSAGGFGGWGGACSGLAPACTVTVNQPFVAVIARFP
ncbi:MAG: hypothetical protein R3B06_02440 [Kofleriaceae bacterium]